MGKPGFPTPLPAWRVWESHALREQPLFLPSMCGVAAWRAGVTIVRRVQPPSQPPPAGGRSRVPAPVGAGQGGGRRRARGAVARAGRPRSQVMCIAAWCAIRMTVSRDHRGTRFPIPPPAGGFGRARLSSRGQGKPGFPCPLPGGRVWEGCVLPGTALGPGGCGLDPRATPTPGRPCVPAASPWHRWRQYAAWRRRPGGPARSPRQPWRQSRSGGPLRCPGA